MLLAALALALAACPALAAMKGEPREFHGVPFGARYAPDASFDCQTDSEEGHRCTRRGDDPHLHGVPLKSVTYLFMYGYLFTVDMEVEGRENFDKLAASLARLHGKPKPYAGGMAAFEGRQVDILLHYDAVRRAGDVSYVFKNLPCPVE
jgi:hypothetical protein